MVGGAALDGRGDDFPGGLLRFLPALGFDLLDLHGAFMAHLRFNAVKQILFRIVLGKAGNFFQHFKLTLFNEVDFVLRSRDVGGFFRQIFFFALKGLQLFVQRFLFLLQSAFLLGDFSAPLFYFLVVFCARFMDFILGFHHEFFFSAFAGADGLVNESGGFLLRAADFTLCNGFAIGHADKEKENRANEKSCDWQDNVQIIHNSTTHLLVINLGMPRKSNAGASRP